jgi:photosystem II stability/assembly factor-like uncharacterized protein
VTSGRVVDLAVDPGDDRHWLVASASGGVWSTRNAGTTWMPVFDHEGSSSIGCVTFASSDPMIAWVGTGENNALRSVGYGDGVYKSVDGGATWTRMGLDGSGHIGRILVDPRDPDVVWVAAQGPLWSPGGDRGLYKTTDGGRSWTRVLAISDDTGVSDIAFDPRNPDVVYAAAWQRRRHVWTVISGGPESALYKTTDGGASFCRLSRGLPSVDLGRIGLAVSPIDPDVIYAILEAADGQGGFFRSTDRGESWEKRSDHTTPGLYYTEIFADPHRFDRVYSMDVRLAVTDDGGTSFRELGASNKHVDDHVIWVDPARRDHYLVGGDGGLYESSDGAASWRFFANLPVTQFYKVALDDSLPFYRVYGGTQDNFTLGGPSRTLTAEGIVNFDWELLTDGDGFQPRVEPCNPDIAYATVQYGALLRVDRRTREETWIQPVGDLGEPPLRWNWDSPFIISPHSPTRLYLAAERIFRSDDRGDHWQPISPDLTRQLDRNQLPVFSSVQRADAVGKHDWTSAYGNLAALAESPVAEGLLYAGSDDGLVQVSEDGGGSWRRIESFPGVPERAYVRKLEPSAHDADMVYAAFDNHKTGDFRPYLLVSRDRGRSWSPIAAGLPKRGTVYALVEDPVDPDLLFVGTEFGLWASQDRGASWFRLTGGLPTVQVRDLAIQPRESDLVLATFGRGFWVLDDLTPLRFAARRSLEAEATIFPVRPAFGYIPRMRLGVRGKGFQGDGFFVAPNPPFGAVFTVHVKENLLSLAQARRQREQQAATAGEAVPYPTHADFRAEDAEEPPAYFLVVHDANGEVVRRLAAPTSVGIHRVAWDLRYQAPDPARLESQGTGGAGGPAPRGPMAAPGSYTVSLERRRLGVTTQVVGPVAFEVEPLAATTLTAPDRLALVAFLRQASSLKRAVLGTSALVSQTLERVALVKTAIDHSTAPDSSCADEARRIGRELEALQLELVGDRAVARRNDPVSPSLLDRVEYIVGVQWSSTSAPTGSSRRQYELASQSLAALLAQLRPLLEHDLPALEKRLDAMAAPWTPGRIPVWPPAAS